MIFKEKKNLLIMGLYEPQSGLTNVMAALVSHLSDEYEIHALGFYRGNNDRSYNAEISGRPIRVCRLNIPVFVPEQGWLEQHMANIGAHAILVIGPLFMVERLLSQLQKYRGETRILLYLPVEGKLVDLNTLSILSLADHCVLYTQFCYNNINALYDGTAPEIITQKPGLSVIGHGLDLSQFFPLKPACVNMRVDLRKTLLPGRPHLENAFIILNANRNYYRKRIDISINGFTLFAKNRPDVFLYLHTGKLCDKELADLQRHINNSGVAGQIMLNTLTSDGKKLSVEQLNGLYNMCDVGLTTSMGEGWGLTAFEHAATGAPQIMPRHTGFIENWQGSAVLVPTTGTEYVFYEYAEMFVVSPRDVAAALSLLYCGAAYYKQMARAALLKSKDTNLNWALVAEKFHEVLELLLENHEYEPAL